MIKNGTVVCDECAAPLVKVSSGFVCPNGHGRIVPTSQIPSKDELRKAAIAALPQATLLKYHKVFGYRSVYSVEGHSGAYRRLSANVSVWSFCADGSFQARYCGELDVECVGVFDRFVELENACREIVELT
jgi:hypothetical protein